VCDALAPFAVELNETPVNPQRLLRALATDQSFIGRQ
jgi:hypothetical protein